MSSSNIETSESESRMAAIYLSRSGKKGFRTLSPARRQELLQQLRLKGQAGKRPQTNSRSSKKSEAAGELASSLSRLMTSSKKLVKTASHLPALGKTVLAKNLLKWKNRDLKNVEFLIHPHPILSARAEEVDFTKTKREELVKIVRMMGAALSGVNYGDRLGIAAPQIGISKRIMVVQGVVMINPTWQPSKAPPNQVVEGCYSVPHKSFEVSRAPYGWAEWYSIDGVKRKYKLNDMNAIIYQHELDHLDGVCCADVGTLLEDKSNEMAKYKVTEDFVLNGVLQKKDSIIDLDYTRANLKSIAGKIVKFDPNATEVTPAPQNKPEAPKVEEKAPETPVASTPEAAKAAEDAAKDSVPPTPAPSAPVEPEKAPETSPENTTATPGEPGAGTPEGTPAPGTTAPKSTPAA